MNLREFILYKLADYRFGNPHDKFVEEYADEILKEFEKRIDDLITEVMKKNGTEIRENGNRIDFRIIYDDQIAILKQVKEMLK
jgi:hypothetical protein